MSCPTSPSLFLFFRLLKLLLPRVKENRLNSEVEFSAPRLISGWIVTHHPSPLQVAVLCIWKCAQVSYVAGTEGCSRNQPMPARALPKLVTNSALPGTVGALLGQPANTADEQYHKTKQCHHHSFCLSSQFSPEWKWEVCGFILFLHTIEHLVYYIAMCTIALTISKYPHRRGALRYALSMEKKKSSKLWKVSYRVLWIGNYEWQIVPGGLKFLRYACAKRPVKKSELLYTKLFLADLLYQQGMLYWSSRSRRS